MFHNFIESYQIFGIHIEYDQVRIQVLEKE